MPPKLKPSLLRSRGEKVSSDKAATAAYGVMSDRSSTRMHYAVKCELEDVALGLPAKGRYGRIKDAIMMHFNCSEYSAEQAVRRAKFWLAERFNEELPARRAEVCRQLQRIADEQEEQDPRASIAALAEMARIIGLHAPMKLEVAQGTAAPNLELQLDAILGVLSPAGRDALRVVLGDIETAKAEGRLALPAGDAAPDEDVEDAEIVGEPGAN